MLGYWKRPDGQRNGVHRHRRQEIMRTGDLGRYDEDGYYYIAIAQGMINASGYKVGPAEVEATLYKHPDIRESP